MKTLGILLASLALGGLALGLGMGLPGLDLDLAGTPAAPAAAFTLRSPDSPAGRLDLTPQERDTVNKALALQGRRIASVRLHAERTAPDPVRARRAEPWAAFSLELTMADGAALASRVRRVPRQRLGAAVAECVADCLRAYDAQLALGRQVRSLSNI